MLAKTYASTVMGVEAKTIAVEVNAGTVVAAGQPFYNLVGLPDNAIKEGFQRIQAALHNVKYRLPRNHLVVNLAPADLRKEGSAYDLPIALGILGATGQLSLEKMENYVIIGELALDGVLRPIRGALPMAIQAKREKFEGIILPSANAREAAIVNDLKVYGIHNLSEAIRFLDGELDLIPEPTIDHTIFNEIAGQYPIDFSDVKGQQNIKRALELTAAGGHNAILIGPPGAGKDHAGQKTPKHPSFPYPSMRHWKRPRSILWLVCSKPKNSSYLHTSLPLSPPYDQRCWLWLGVAPTPVLERSVWPTTGYCSWMNCLNSNAPPSRFCANPWKTGKLPSAGPGSL
jgi:magnesium chelatase family protein